MQDEQGFDNNEKIELVDFNYRPLSIQHEMKRNVIGHPRTKDSIQEVRYIPECQLRQEWFREVVNKEQHYVVFNNLNQQVGIQEQQMQFQADFESSNLEVVIKRKYLQYQLYMRPDTNTTSYFQWFYFRVKWLKAKKTVTFTLKNFVKTNMLYTQGLKPFFKSDIDSNSEYAQLASEVKYSENDDGYYELKFKYQFQKQGQAVQFCSQPPYTYSKLIQRLSLCKARNHNLCKSQLGKRVPYLIYNEEKQTKAVVIAIARQHPGEAVGSWMMEGLINTLQQGMGQSVLWVVIPMVNVDGVILGNNRTGFAGLDYNRFWNLQQIQKKEKCLPQLISIFGLLKMIRRKHPKKVKMFLDFHGHSSQSNVFSYGPPHEQGTQNFILSRIFPELLAKRNQNFSLQQCSYKIKQDKKNTARSMLYSLYNFPFSYTIQASFGLMQGKMVGVREFIKMGEDIGETTSQFILNYLPKQRNSQINNFVHTIRQKYKQKGEEAEEYDSDSEVIIEKKDLQLKTIVHSTHNKPQIKELKEKPSKVSRRVVTDINQSYRKDSQEESNNFHLFKIHEASPQKRYVGRRNQTQNTLQKNTKVSYLPKLKQTLTFRQKSKVAEGKETQHSISSIPQNHALTNIKQIQKHLFRLRNSRVGKKILIINAYGI